MNELALFVSKLRHNIAMLSIPGFEYIEEAISEAWKSVEEQRQNERRYNGVGGSD